MNSEEPLRRIISTFCASQSLALQEQPEFNALIHARGDFVVDWWDKVGIARKDEQMRVKKFQTLSAENKKLQRECATLLYRTLEVVRDNEQVHNYNAYILYTIHDCYKCRSKSFSVDRWGLFRFIQYITWMDCVSHLHYTLISGVFPYKFLQDMVFRF